MGFFDATPEKIEKWVSGGKVKKLIGCLTSNDAIIRRLATEGMARVGNKDVYQYCQTNATSDNEKIRWSITQMLGLMGTPQAIEILSKVQDPTSKIGMRKKKIEY